MKPDCTSSITRDSPW